MSYFRIGFLPVVMAAVLGVGLTTPSEARIVCDGQFQVINGSPHATPWCEDTYLAQVAHTYGMRVTARSVRQNPSVKQNVCRLVGHDIRVSNICAGLRDQDEGNKFRRR